MIRFLQKDSRLIKGVFIAIISVACVTMVVTLVPGVFNSADSSSANYAVVRGGNPFTRLFTPSVPVPMQDVQQAAARMLQRQGWPEAAMPFMVQRVGQGMVQQAVMLSEANRLGLQVDDSAVRRFLHQGPIGAAIFPGGKFIGEDRYAELVQDNFGMSVSNFEAEIKKELEEARLRDLVTGGVSVNDDAVRASYRNNATKIKFSYGVFAWDDVAKTINPSDDDLQKFFKSHAALYSTAIPEARKLQYIVFTGDQVPGGVPQVTDAEEQAYYNAHTNDYKLDEQAKVRHILIKVAPNASPADDAAAKTKAQGILDQIHKGGDFADLAKKFSDDPGSKDQGGELTIKRGQTVPEFDKAAFGLQPGQVSGLVKTQFGYHIIKLEDHQTPHTKSFDEVKSNIAATLTEQKQQQAEGTFATQIVNESKKSGLAGAAAAHHLQMQSTDYVSNTAALPGVADSSKLLTAAFSAAKGAAPQVANTGDGMAVFQVQDVKPAHAPDFATYKSHILDDYRTQQAPVLLEQKATQLADKARSEHNLQQAAKELGANVKTSDLVGRDAQVPDIGAIAQTAPQLFDMSEGQISGPIKGDRTGVVAQIEQKQIPDAADVNQHLAQAKAALLDQQREQSFAVFVTNLVQEYQKAGRISVNKQAAGMPSLPGQSQGQ